MSQPSPKPNEETPIWDLVLEDIKERDKLGLKKYGVRLQPFNGRNSPLDAYEEILDLVVYFRQWTLERAEMVLALKKAYFEHKDPDVKDLLAKLGELDD